MSAIIDGSNASSLPADSTINGVTVGKGGGNGANNTVVGYQAFTANTSGTGVAVGAYALSSNTTGTSNTAVGGYDGTTLAALRFNTTGSSNSAFGVGALASNTTASNNTAVGFQALYANTTGAYNTAVGGVDGNSAKVLGTCTTGNYNTAVGGGAFGLLTTGSYNVAIGFQAGQSLTTSNSNILIGPSAGYNITTGQNNVMIGDSCRPSAASGSYQISIGFNLASNNDNYVALGKNGAYVYCNFSASNAWTQTSDARLKTNVKEDSLGLDFICKLRPVTFNWKPSNEVPKELTSMYTEEGDARDTQTVIHGLIAQDVKQALDEVGVSTFNGWTVESDGTQAVSREMFITPLIKAIQELKAEVDSLKAAK